MHDSTDRHSHSTMMVSSPNRFLNLSSTKSHRTSQQQQQNLVKKMKISHINGESSTIRNSKSDTSLRCPLRRTLPIFKQPVTYYSNQCDEVKPQITSSTGGKSSEKSKPKQLFWEKRFENICATDIDGQPFQHFTLPDPIQSVGLNMSPTTAVISLATSLHLYSNSRALFGQNNQFQKYPTTHIQRDQPLIEHVTITDEHIRAQEEKVNELRRRIQQVMRNNSNVKLEA